MSPLSAFAATHWYDVVGALGAAVGGLGAAAGAIAAWRAASASRASARDALEALAIGIAPTLTVDFRIGFMPDPQGRPAEPARWIAIIENQSTFAARDVTLDVRFREGNVVRDRVERIPAPVWPVGVQGAHLREVLLAEVPLPPAPPPITAEEATLRYSDERDIARYEQRYAFMFSGRDGSPTGGAMPSGDRLRIR